MKILVVGANGRVGQELVTLLAQAKHEVVAGVRRPEAFPAIDGVTPVKFDLQVPAEEMVPQIKDFDAVISTAGSAGKSLLQVDLFGNVKLMQAAEQAGVRRFVLLSSLFALDLSKWDSAGIQKLQDYYIAKHFADLYLTNDTQLDWTVLQPGTLVEEPATGKVAFGVAESGKNAIPDVAAVIAAIVDADNTISKVITMHEGDEAVATAVAAL